MNQLGILIVDDYPVYCDALREKLRLQFEPTAQQMVTPGSAGEGLETVHANPLLGRLVLLDILMPGLSGLAISECAVCLRRYGITAFRLYR